MKKTANKQSIILFLGLTLLIAILLLLFLNQSQEVTLKLKSDKFTFEFGEDLDLNPSLYLKEDLNKNSKILVEYQAQDINNELSTASTIVLNVGTYPAKVVDDVNELVFTIHIVDTTPPKFVESPESLNLTSNDSNFDFKSLIKAQDLSSFQIHVDTSQIDFNIDNQYVLLVEAIDEYKNKASLKIPVTIANPQTEMPFYFEDILVVNKKHPLPSDYNPLENEDAARAVKQLIADMQKQGYDISSNYSGYRSYAYQAQLYNQYTATYGQAAADTFSARPGFSEHQSGLAFDLLNQQGQLVEAPSESDYIANNAHKYGFIVRYLPGKEASTGYQAEPWHLRYVGEKATEIYESKLSLEEFLHVTGGDYEN